VTQRLKRIASIRNKLMRGDVRDLSSMQDMGGCRAVVETVRDIHALYDLFSKRKCAIRSVRDYLQSPRSSGYRGKHLVVEYAGRNRHEHDGLRVEIQTRTKLQHRWAAAVETLSFLAGCGDLKANRGHSGWLAFLAVMGELYAIADGDGRIDGEVTVPEGMRQKLREFEFQLEIQQTLMGFQMAVDFAHGRTGIQGLRKDIVCFVIAQFNNSVSVRPYWLEDLERANSELIEAERLGHNAVLVFADDLKALRCGYPSYFADISMFRGNALTAAFGSSYKVAE
jgi:hypothetical protein